MYYAESRDNIEAMMGNETDGIIEDLFDSLLKRYQKSLEDLIKRSKMVFHNIDL